MKSRLDDVPVLKSKSSTVDAAHFNTIRLGLLRLGAPLRYQIPELRGLDILMDDQLWLCVDRTLDDLPVIAWKDFDVAGRAGLDQPIPCTMLYFHAHGDVIVDKVLDFIASKLDRLIHADLDVDADNVRNFPLKQQ